MLAPLMTHGVSSSPKTANATSATAAARMKNGEPCSLPELLAADPEFRLTAEEIRSGLQPEKYIGRCPEQVTAYLVSLKPLLGEVSAASVDISV